jgi:hypothetical protein
MVYLRNTNDLKWNVHYIGCQGSVAQVKQTYYTNPVPGGSFKIDPNMLEKYSFLCDFVATKPLEAAIMIEVEKLALSNNFPSKDICCDAVMEELANAQCARAFLTNYVRDLESVLHIKVSHEDCKTYFYQFYATNYVNFTLVMHPVGRHMDVFADKQPSLENRVCFCFPLDKFGKTNVKNTGYRYGQGGCGLNQFCFALLDWTSENKKCIRCWTHGDNAHIPGSAAFVANETGVAAVRLNRRRWQTFVDNARREIHWLPPDIDAIDNLIYQG